MKNHDEADKQQTHNQHGCRTTVQGQDIKGQVALREEKIEKLWSLHFQAGSVVGKHAQHVVSVATTAAGRSTTGGRSSPAKGNLKYII